MQLAFRTSPVQRRHDRPLDPCKTINKLKLLKGLGPQPRVLKITPLLFDPDAPGHTYPVNRKTDLLIETRLSR